MFWNRFPFLRILLPFLTGILVAFYIGFEMIIPVYIFFALYLIYALLVIVFPDKLSYRSRWIPGALIIVFFFLSGYQLNVLQKPVNNTHYFGKYIAKNTQVVCTLTEPVQVRERSCKAIVEMVSVKDSAGWHHTSGKAMIYFQKDSLSEKLKYGDNILLAGNFNTVHPPMNPGEFDYKTYLKNRSVEYSAFLKKDKWALVSSGNGCPLLNYTYSLRQKLLAILDKSGLSGREYGVISALLIGYTDKLDPDLIKDYQGSGAMHILSVSGMHVGVIYLVLNFFLFFFDKFKYGRVPKAVMLILFVWFYAVLTGLSPAVFRAATMFSLIALGNAFKYPPNIFNTLAASAFVLLVYNPFFLFDIGFQLSYLAVIGIVTIYPVIYKSWHPEYWLVNKLWSLIAVSIAAQIVTFPLSLYYFHQFPNYFILTNMAAVPLSALVIYLGIAYLVFYWVPYLGIILGKALTWSLLGLNGSVSFIENLPFSVSRSISINGAEMILLYLIITFVFLFVIFKKPKMFIAILCLTLIILSSFTINRVTMQQQKKIIVYNVSKHTAIDFIDGSSCYFVSDSSLKNDNRKHDFYIANSRILNHTKKLNSYTVSDSSAYFADNVFYKNLRFIYFAGKRMVIVDKATTNPRKIPVDMLLISNNPDISIDELLTQYNPGLIIMDASNSATNIKKWIKQCIIRDVPFYVTSNTGAFISQINS